MRVMVVFQWEQLNVSGKINSTLGTGTALELTSTKDIDINFQRDGALVVNWCFYSKRFKHWC